MWLLFARLEAVRYLLTVPRAEFRLLAEPDAQPAILEGYLRQLPHDDTVIDFTGAGLFGLRTESPAPWTSSTQSMAMPCARGA